jgi:glycerophosphoryl diester phosphodiesterase
MMILKGHTIPIIELKVTEFYRQSLEDRVLQTLQDFNLMGESVIVSFSKEVLRRVKEKAPQVATGYVTALAEELQGDPSEGIDVLSVFFRILSEETLEWLRGLGKIVFVWTVNEEQNMKDFARMGVDGIASDDPILLKKVLTGHY